jgi:hypothetical protein
MSTDFTPALVTPQPCPETVKIADADSELGYVIINASDFDAKTMKLFSDKKAAPKADT